MSIEYEIITEKKLVLAKGCGVITGIDIIRHLDAGYSGATAGSSILRAKLLSYYKSKFLRNKEGMFSRLTGTNGLAFEWK